VPSHPLGELLLVIVILSSTYFFGGIDLI